MVATSAAWGGASLTVTIGGTDVSCDVLEVTVDRGRNRVWDPPDAGTCQVHIDISAAGQPSSRGPVGDVVVVSVAYGSTSRTIFTGKVQQRRIEYNPQVLTGTDVLILGAVDEFETLGRVNRRADIDATPEGGSETVDDRINRWLDVAGSTSDRDIITSTYTCPPTLIDGNVLLQLQAAALADGGDFFVKGDGTVTFVSFAWRNSIDSPTAIYSDRRLYDWVPYSSVLMNDDLDEVQNNVTGTRRAINSLDVPVPYTVSNSGSVTDYGERGDALDDLELEDDDQVVTRIDSLVTIAARPNPRFDAIVVQPSFDPSRMYPRTIPVTIGHMIACNRIWPDGTQTALNGHVLAELWTITPHDWTIEYRCSGTGTWDGTRPPRAPVLEYCTDGTLHVKDGYPCDDTSTVLIKDADGNVLATYPPGSLCACGVVVVPDGGVEVCLDDGTTQTCTDITDPRLAAILWFDAENDIPDAMRERIEGDPIDPGVGFSATRLDVIDPGDYDSIDATSGGGIIGGSHSTKLQNANVATGWRIEFYLSLDTHLGAATDITLIDLGTIQLHLTTMYEVTGPYITQLEVLVIGPDPSPPHDIVAHLSGALANVSAGDGFHGYTVHWDGTDLHVFVDGIEV
jgi:hypothetical protein